MKENPITVIFSYAKDNKSKLILSAVLSVISVLGGLIPFMAAANILNLLVSGNSDKGQIITIGLSGMAAFAFKEIVGAISTYISHGVAFKTLSNIRTAILDKIERTSLGYIKGQSLGKYKKMIIDDVDSLEYVLAHAIPEVTSNTIAPIILLIYMCTINWRSLVAGLISTIIGITLAAIMMAGGAKRIFKVFTEGSERMNSTVIEYINGMEVIKVFNQTTSSMEKYGKSVINYRDVMDAWHNHCYPFLAGNNVIAPLSIAFVLPLCGISYINGSMTLNDMIFSIILSLGVAEPIQKLISFTDHFHEINMVYGNLKNIFNAPEITEGNSEEVITKNSVSVEHVRFGYSEEEIIHDISFKAEAGTMTALVGASGSGKSTLAQLVARLYEPNEGKIKIDNVDIKDMSFDDYYNLISYVSQDNYLPNVSLRDNILMGKPDATEEEFEKAVEAAGCNVFANKFENRYDTLVGDAGDRLSGGEKQRVSIARAIIKNAPILILDEATASIDPENESEIQIALNKLSKGKTLIVIAHRLSTIINADNIIVVDKGNILIQGTHNELLKKSSEYKKMWKAHIGAKDWSMISDGYNTKKEGVK